MKQAKIENALIHAHLIRFSDEKFVSPVARTVDEARKLVEVGFAYVTEIDDVKIFRKRR
jgi:hypothetical protein